MTGAVLASSVSRGGLMSGTLGGAGFSGHRIARRRLAVERQPQDLAKRLIGILRGRHALAIAARQEEVAAVRRKCDCRADLSAPAFGHLAPQHFQSLQARRALADDQSRARQREARSFVARLRIGEVDVVVGRVVRRHEHAQHAALTLMEGGRNILELRLGALLRHKPDRADLLRHEHASIGQESDPPRQREGRHLGEGERHACFRRFAAHVDLCLRCARHESQQECRIPDRFHKDHSNAHRWPT